MTSPVKGKPFLILSKQRLVFSPHSDLTVVRVHIQIKIIIYMEKKKMNKFIAVVMVLVMLLALCACGAAPAATDAPDSAPTTANTEAHDFRFSLSNSSESVHGQNILHWIDNIDAARGEGKTGISITLYPNNQLGSVDEMLEQIMMGENIILSTDPGALKNWAPELAILECPYFFENEQEPTLIFQTEWFQNQLKTLEEHGIKVLSGEMIYGSRHIMATDPIRNSADMVGLKIRVPGNDVSVSMIEAMGGTATPMSLSEVYAAIQQGVINGMENPFATHIDNNMWEVCDYLSLTGHQITTSWYVMSADVFNALPASEQEFLMATAADARDYFNSINTAANEAALQTLRDKGVTVVDDVDIAEFKEATASVYDKFGYSELRAEIYAQMDQFR